MNLNHVLKDYKLTEKSNQLSSTIAQYTFSVDMYANKYQIKDAVELAYNVKVARVNVMNYSKQASLSRSRSRRPGYTSRLKKAIVTLKPDYKIEVTS